MNHDIYGMVHGTLSRAKQKKRDNKLLSLSDRRQSGAAKSFMRHRFSDGLITVLVIIHKNDRDYAICNPHSFFIFASFFKFMHAKVSATFIFIRALPYICVYLNPWFSFAVPKILSIVSFL